MTDVTPRPMATPDLAGLLAKPRRPSDPHEESLVRPEPPVSELEMTHQATEGLHQRVLDDSLEVGDGATSTGSGRKSSVSARNRRDRTANSAGAQTPGRQYLR